MLGDNTEYRCREETKMSRLSEEFERMVQELDETGEDQEEKHLFDLIFSIQETMNKYEIPLCDLLRELNKLKFRYENVSVHHHITTCPDCNGTGLDGVETQTLTPQPCSSCNGTG